MALPARTTGSTEFVPDILFKEWGNGLKTLPENDDLRSSIISTFCLPRTDDYVYHAIASVTLTQVQAAISHGGQSGLHNWYPIEEGKAQSPPPAADTSAYTSMFASNTTTSKALTAFAANAKKGSIRAGTASHLQSQRLLPLSLKISRAKTHTNPYYDFWCWSCQNLEWVGPDECTANVKTSHHILPVFMHHFGCVVPSYESLEVIRHVLGKKAVIDVGSGNGYWTYMLRRMGVTVQAVDNLQSKWRTMWIRDTIVMDGEKFLKDGKGCEDAVLLLVYPIVGLDFTSKILAAFAGDTVVVAGTQNRSGYTAFKDKTIDEYMATERRDLQKMVQIALPSFAGKDDALFIFQRSPA